MSEHPEGEAGANPFTEEARRLLAEGQAKLRNAKTLALQGSLDAESTARASLCTLRRAMDWGESDATVFGDAHAALDRAGRWVRETFGCRLTFVDGHYRRTCPVDLAHVRAGMSVGGIVKSAECSICGEDPISCSHVVGREYDGECCHRIIREMDLVEISLVPRPVDPDARIESCPVPTSGLLEQLGPGFEVGMPVSCDICLRGCRGLTHLNREDGGSS